MIESLPSMLEALGLICSTAKMKEKKEDDHDDEEEFYSLYWEQQ